MKQDVALGSVKNKFLKYTCTLQTAMMRLVHEDMLCLSNSDRLVGDETKRIMR